MVKSRKIKIRYKISIINIVVVVGAVEKLVCPILSEIQPKARPQSVVVKLWGMFGIFFHGKFLSKELRIVELKFKKSGKFC